MWQQVDEVYHETDADQLRVDILTFPASTRYDSCQCTLFGCKLWNGARPGISPFGTQRLVFPAYTVLESPNDILIPTNPYPDPSADPPGFHASIGGNTHVELVYIRLRDIVDEEVELTYTEWEYLKNWQLKNHPFIQSTTKGGPVMYLDIRGVWWYILTPYNVSRNDASVEAVAPGNIVHPRPRIVTNSVTLNLVQNLRAFKSNW
jgi:hypothetical protein